MRIFLVLATTIMALNGLTLSESIDSALSNSPTVLISKSDIAYNKHLKDESIGGYHPTLQAKFSWQDIENPTAFSFSPSYNYGLHLKYNLFNGMSDYYNIESKESDLNVAKYKKNAIMADLKLEVIVAYTNYLKAKKLIKSQTQQLESLTKQYDNTNVKYEQGIIAKNDLLLIDVERLNAQQSLFKAKSDLKIAKSNLENIIVHKISESETIVDLDENLVKEPQELSYLEDTMFKNRSEIKAILAKNKSLLSQRDALSGNYLPKVNLEASHQINDKQRSSGTTVFQSKDQTTYGVNVTWSIFSGFKNLAMKKAILEKSNQQVFELHQLKLDLKKQLIQAYENLKVAKSAKRVALRAKESAQENYRITADRYSYGDVDTLTLLVSQSNLTQAINKNNDAYYNLYLADKVLKRIIAE